MLRISKYVELKGKADRGEAIRSITFGEMCEQFIAQEKRKTNKTTITSTDVPLMDIL